jgi:homoserine dehydrogenase
VVADLMEVAREIRRGRAGRVSPLSYMPDHLETKPSFPTSEIHGRVYLRFTARDEPGVLSHITGALADCGIGIESLIQKGQGTSGQAVPVIVLTHAARESAVRAALEEIDRLSDVTDQTRMIRIEEEV